MALPRLPVKSTVRSAIVLALYLAASPARPDDPPERLDVVVHRSFPHDADAFTQGLVWYEGKLYESTGRYGVSELRRLDPQTGRVERRRPISRLHFGEGLARRGPELVMLTWHAGRAYVFDLQGFATVGDYSYRGEGWGLCHDGARFVMSDGSSELGFRDETTFQVIGSVTVRADGREVRGLNELECVAGAVYANVFQEDFIVRIDPASGRVTALIDAGGLLDPAASARADVLNGVAYDSETARFYITGKLWPRMFEVTFE